MKKISCYLSLIFLLGLIYHTTGFSLYEELISHLHSNQNLDNVSNSSSDGICLTFEGFEGMDHSIYLHKKLIKDFNLESTLCDLCENTLKFKEHHPLTILFYIGWRQTNQIPIEYVSDWDSDNKTNEQIAIIADIHSFAEMLQIKYDPQKLRKAIFDYITANVDNTNWISEIEQLRDGVISKETYNFLYPEIVAESKKEAAQRALDKENLKHDAYYRRTKNRADKIINQITKNEASYQKRLLHQTNENKKNPHIVIATNKIYDQKTREAWRKAIRTFDHQSFTLEIHSADTTSKCLCVCCCFLFCWPCMCAKACKEGCPDYCENEQELWLLSKKV